jgi:FkbM family methyltransferase
MKNQVTLKDNKWVWPIIDENSWEGQNQFTGIADKILPYVKNKNIMIQAGGNCGFLLSKFVEHFNTVYTFEPDPVNFYCLNQNITASNVIKMQCCLGNTPTPVTVQQLVRPDRLHDTGGVHIAGPGHTPTIIIDNLNLPGCDLIQLDVEGYELNALLGATETIKKYKPVLCIEFCEKWLNRYNDSSEGVLKLVHSLGYTLVDEYGVDKIFIHNEL